MLITKNL